LRDLYRKIDTEFGLALDSKNLDEIVSKFRVKNTGCLGICITHSGVSQERYFETFLGLLERDCEFRQQLISSAGLSNFKFIRT
jgi:hypothetical protein